MKFFRQSGTAHPDAHFATDHLLNDLRNRSISSGIVTGVTQAASLLMNLGAVVVLARLLAPQDFGIVAMVLSITGFFRILGDAGLSMATIQKEGVTHSQVSNLFWANLLLGGAVTILLALSAPVVAWFFQEPRLTPITLALSTTFIMISMTVQHQALLKRQMRFTTLALIQTCSTGIGVFTGIAMASLDYGYWSLVAMQLFTAGAGCILTWWLCRWRPQLPSRQSEMGSLLGFGANLTVSGLLWSLARGLDNILVGKWFGTEALGYYSRATSLLNRSVEQGLFPLETVFLPTLSRLQHQPERYSRAVSQIYDLLALCSLPLLGILLVMADPIILVVLGSKWEATAPIFGAFTLYAFFLSIGTPAGWLLTSQGRGKEFLMMSCFCSSVSIASYLLGLRFGPLGVALSFSLSCLVIQLPFVYWIAGREGLVRTKDLWALLMKYIPLWGTVCVTTWLVKGALTNAAPLTQLCIGVPIGLLAALVTVAVLPGLRHAATSLLELGLDWIRNGRAQFAA